MASPVLIGSSPKFRAVLENVQIVAPVSCAILLRGETGTGKEVIAQAIHDDSPRRQHRFVTVNCAAIPAALLESELFGHERGAFTGAGTSRMGRFQAADRGTLFLDEIGELPIELQPKLLRALQAQEFERLGSSQTTRVDVRIVAATDQNLEQMVSERRFRMDLTTAGMCFRSFSRRYSTRRRHPIACSSLCSDISLSARASQSNKSQIV